MRECHINGRRTDFEFYAPYGCDADYDRARSWVEENADRIDELPDPEAAYRMCCADLNPLEMAVLAERRDLAAKLIARGARTVDVDRFRLHLGWDYVQIFDFLCQSGGRLPSFDMLALTIKRGEAGALFWLLGHGGDPNSQRFFADIEDTESVETLLDVAVSRGDLYSIRVLLTRGAVIRPETIEGVFFRWDDAAAAARLFLSAGATLPVHIPNERGETLLWRVCRHLGVYQDKAGEHLVTLLIEQGAEVNAASNETGTTPLMFAGALGDVKVMSLLLRAGADPSARDSEGRTALDYARIRGRTKTAEMLVLAAGNREQG